MYNHRNRYRCTIIRGKAQSQVEDLLPVYANIIIECEGNNKELFDEQFNRKLSNFLSSPTEKTLNNHRTEIAGKLFGMFYFENDSLIVAPRTYKLMGNGDLPQFFKSIIVNFQFPNGLDAIQTITERVNSSISLKPFHFIVNLLNIASKKELTLTKNEVAYYVLDSKDVLQGLATPIEVLQTIEEHRNKGIENKVEYARKASSYSMQHISEQLNLLELSNVIVQDSISGTKIVRLNKREGNFIKYLIDDNYSELDFNIYDFYNNRRDELALEWARYYSSTKLIDCLDEETIIDTEVEADKPIMLPRASSPLEIGDAGENIVFTYEKERVKAFNARLAQQKVLLLGKQRGLGYDIQSVWADLCKKYNKEADEAYFIEVKSTKRITKPDIATADKVILTRNEWLAANQHKESYSIFRVYLTRSGVFVYKIFNPLENSDALCTPINYNYEFSVADELEKW